MCVGFAAPGPSAVGPDRAPTRFFFSFFFSKFFFSFFFYIFFSAVTSVGRILTLRKNDDSECRNRNRFC